MATGNPEARRIIFGTHVVPTYSIEGEETSVRHTEFQTSPAGTLGGKGIASIDKDQWGDGWVSFSHQGAYWEDQDDVWELLGEAWSGELNTSYTGPTSGINLTDDTSPCKFLYIKNIGSTNHSVLVSLNGGSSYRIKVPPGGSVNLRGDGVQLLCNEVCVSSNGSLATFEFIIAK